MMVNPRVPLERPRLRLEVTRPVSEHKLDSRETSGKWLIRRSPDSWRSASPPPAASEHDPEGEPECCPRSRNDLVGVGVECRAECDRAVSVSDAACDREIEHIEVDRDAVVGQDVEAAELEDRALVEAVGPDLAGDDLDEVVVLRCHRVHFEEADESRFNGDAAVRDLCRGNGIPADHLRRD